MQLRQVVCLIFLASISCLKGQPPPCGAGEWRCFDGSCVAAAKKCNGKSDCLDGSDEVDCRGPSVLSACPPGQFACVGPPGCVPDSALCDGLRHCVSGSDEANCQGCLDSDWTCRNRMCVPKELRCDGNNDCLDNSDELSCGRCDPPGVQCPDGACLSPQERCDGKVQCSDGSDEPATCGHRCSESNGGCSHVCVDKPWGVLCTCPPGYKVAENGAVCQDIDECSLPYGSCLHYCINTMGSYYCHCRDDFTVQGSTGCKATGNPTRLLSVWKKSISLLSLKAQRLPVVQNLGTDPVALTFDLARGLYFWVDSQGSIHRTDMKQSVTLYTEAGITSLACDWLTGQLYWSNLKTQSICVGAANGSAYATLLKRNVSPYELVLLPSESSMFWIDKGPADRTTLEKARMDGSMRGSLVVLTTQDAICLTLDVGSRRLYWISVFKMSVETVKVDGSGRYSFLGIFSSRQALNLAVFDSQFYWSDEKGLWSASLNTPKQKTFILRTPPSILAVFHELQQPRGYSPCLNRPCLLCLPSVAHPASSSLGFSCICPDDRLLLPDGTCDYPRFAYATAKGVSLLEFKGSELLKTPIFSAQDDLLSFDVDWYRNWLYWANATGHVQRTGIAQIKTEDIPTLKAACIIKVDQRNGNLYWLSCDQFYIGATDINRGYSQQLYHAGNEVNDIYPDWLGGMLYWLEAGTVFTMRLLGGNTRKLFSVGGGVTGGLTLDWRANSLLWNTKDGLSTASLLQGELHQDKRWKISGSVVAALEPFLLSLSGNTLTLWNRMDVRSVQKVTVESGVISVILAFKSVKPVSSTAKTCTSPSVLCPQSSLCISQSQLCDGQVDCPDGFDEQACVKTCPERGDFRCKDRRSCVTRSLLCDGRSHCLDGSDELNCPTVAAPTTQAAALKCRLGTRLCKNGKECVLYSHVCDGERDCQDGSDEQGCQQVCKPDEFLCGHGRSCIPRRQVCDGRAQCQDRSDELDCWTPTHDCQHRCDNKTRCIPESFLCDGERDCLDGTDEEDCVSTKPALDLSAQSTYKYSPPVQHLTPPATTPACITPSVSCPQSSICISQSQMCDGQTDCPDGFDEQGCVTRCPNRADFRCKDRRSCVTRSLLCDGRSHCLDGSDELNCPTVAAPTTQAAALKCRLGSRLCKNGRQCVLYSHVCDGERDCQDGSDEQECDVPLESSPTTVPLTTPACTSPSALCPQSLVCIFQSQMCDGQTDCPDGFDEQGCITRCPNRADFRCKDRRSCVTRSLLCDGRSHCLDGSDELNCPTVAAPTTQAAALKCRLGSRLCKNGRQCVLYSHVCDGERDCQDGSDEQECDVPLESSPTTVPLTPPPVCTSPSALCPQSLVCISQSQICDGQIDCPDGFDEQACVKTCPKKGDFRCKDRRSCVTRSLLCDGRSHCLDGSDELNCPTVAAPTTQAAALKCRLGTRLCKNGKECVLYSHVCDGERDCQDGSDEQGCQQVCKPDEFQCSHRMSCIPRRQVCDGRAQCQDRSDELDCWTPTHICQHRCDNRTRCIPESFLCDGERDCLDGTDEEDCDFVDEAPGPNMRSFVSSSSPPPPQPACITPSVLCPQSLVCISQSQMCDGQTDCPDGFDERVCVNTCPYKADFRCKDRRSCVTRSLLCDGRSHCLDGSDELNCPTVAAPTTQAAALKCRLGSRLCKNGRECVLYSHVCDGERDCQDGSDEQGCQQVCKPDEFQCGHGSSCIPREQVCDGRAQCQDRSDELDCWTPTHDCQHRCDNKTRCIPESFLCDGERDCLDGTDEEDCGVVSCARAQYRCASGQCVSEALRCDGHADCKDHSDEAGCSKPPRCPPELRCARSHECLVKEWICDGEEDCPDGSDERNCQVTEMKCGQYQWRCASTHQCVPLSWRCDKQIDCEDWSDEAGCGKRKCQSHLFQCGSGECIDPSLVCSRVTNCPDRSDEGPGCALQNCTSPTAPRCGQHCISTPHGPRCGCKVGFSLASNGVLCVDVDECAITSPPVCSHSCLNTRGSYLCRCQPGYYLEPDMTSCKTTVEPLLLASVQSELLLLGVRSSSLRLLTASTRPVFTLDYHWLQSRVYWLSPEHQSIMWTATDDSQRLGRLVKGVKTDSIAVDWVGRNLYWVDGLAGQILAVRLGNATVSPQNYTVVLDEDLEQPHSLVLLPDRGLMLWSEIGSDPQIERSGMDGSRRKVLVSRSLNWPVSLAVDLLADRFYWTDERMHCIGSASLEGDDIRLLQLTETPSPFSIAVFDDKVYWSDTRRRTIQSANKITGKDRKVLLKRPGQPFGLRLMHPLAQADISSPCDRLKCSHLCLLAPGPGLSRAVRGPAAVCRCPAGLLLSGDGVTCSLPVDSTFLLLLAPTTITQIYLRTLRKGVGLKKWPEHSVLPLPGVVDASGLDAAIQAKALYVADAGQSSVGLLKLTSQGLSPAGRILKLQDDSVTALAVDWVTANLYWSSSLHPDLHVTSSPDSYTVPLLQGSLQGTTSIAVHPPSGRLCFTAVGTEKGESLPQVDCCYMDGRRHALLWRKSRMPTSLVFSSQGTVLYWADMDGGVVSSISVDGTGYKEFKAGPGLLVSVTRTENMLLWVTTDKGISQLWVSDDFQPKQLWFEVNVNVVALRAYSKASQKGVNACSNRNGECDQLCLAYPGGRTCRCGREFHPVNRTSCSPSIQCPEESGACWDGSTCLLSAKFCDGQFDCPDQSDEQDCPYSNVASYGAKPKDGRPPSPSDSPEAAGPRDGLSDSQLCDQQQCSRHGACEVDGGVARCRCHAGYHGVSCQKKGSGGVRVFLTLGLICLIIGLVIAAVVLWKRRVRAARGRSTEKETLMTDMETTKVYTESFANDLYDPEDQEVAFSADSSTQPL